MNSKIIIALSIIFFSSINIYAQQEYKTVNDAKGLSVGTKIENFSAVDQDNKLFSLDKQLEKGKVIVIFYRGHWCPICKRHLSDLQDSLALIQAKGVKVIAISPEKPEYASETVENTGANFTLLYDQDYKISKMFDVLYRPKGSTRLIYNTMLGANLKKSHSDDSQQLPIPATFIIDENSKITWRQFNPDYHNRASVKEILEQL